MSDTWPIVVSAALAVWIVGLSVWILFERRSPVATLAWILALGALPVVGIPIYFFLGPRRFDRRRRRRDRAQACVARARGGDHAAEDGPSPGARRLIAICESAAGMAARPRTAEIELYTAGVDLFAALEQAIDGASHHIHLEYYIWSPFQLGTRLRDKLTARARAGVEVRVLLDGFGSNRANRRFWRPLLEAGGQVARFNAPTLRRLGQWRMASFRTHRKIAVIDGRIGFTGGMNVTDGHTAEFSGDRAWRDTHLRIEGRAVRGLQMVFCEGWQDVTGSAPEGHLYFPHPDQIEAGAHTLQVVSSGPDENLDAIHKLFFSAITGANHRVYLTSPYFVPGDAMFNALATAALRGADVRVLVPAVNDLRLVGAASRSYYPELLEVGVRIFEYGPPMLHAKTLVVDDVVAVVGTANADARSFRLNFEVVVADYDPSGCARLIEVFEKDLERAVEITPETVAGYRFRRRLGQNFARLLSPVL